MFFYASANTLRFGRASTFVMATRGHYDIRNGNVQQGFRFAQVSMFALMKHAQVVPDIILHRPKLSRVLYDALSGDNRTGSHYLHKHNSQSPRLSFIGMALPFIGPILLDMCLLHDASIDTIALNRREGTCLQKN